MVRKRSVRKEKNKLATKRYLNISENEKGFSKKVKLEHKLISVTISKKNPEINIDEHEIQ